MTRTRLSLNYIIFFLVMTGGALYIEFPLVGKPYIPISILGILLFLIYVFFGAFLPKRDVIFLGLFFSLFVVFFVKAILSDNIQANSQIFNILLLPIVFLTAIKVDDISFFKILKLHFLLCYVVFGVEAAYRYLHPMYGGKVISGESLEAATFYAYKVNSIMFTNSNGVGMQCVFMLALLFSIYVFKNKEFGKRSSVYGLGSVFFYLSSILLICFTIASLSRAAMLLCGILVVVYLTFRSAKVKNAAIIFFPALLVVGTLGVLSLSGEVVEFDASLSTKFDIFNNLLRYLSDASLSQVLFGNVMDPPGVIYNGFEGYYGHTHYFDIVFSLGFIFGSAYLYIFIHLATRLKTVSLFFLISFFLLGMSNIRIFGHYLFIYLGALLVVGYKFEAIHSARASSQ